MALRRHLGSIALLTVLAAAVTAGFEGCSSSSNSSGPATDAGGDSTKIADSGVDTGSPPMDSGNPDTSSGHDTGTGADTGAAEGGDGGGLTAQALAGIAASPFMIPTAMQTEQVGMGSYLVNVVSSCPDCHNNPMAIPSAGFLAGGNQFGPVQARNLTSDTTHGLRMTQQQFVETLQTGKDQKLSPDGGSPVALIVMPWEDFRWMSATDLQNIYSYLQLVPADPNSVPFGPPGGPPIPVSTTFTDGTATPGPTLPAEASDAPLFSARGRAIQALPEPSKVSSLSTADQAAYGRGAYLVGAAAICGECHTNPERTSMTSTTYNTAEWLTGGRVFVAPAPLNSIVHVTRSMSANLLGANNGFIFNSKVNETVFTTTIQTHVHGDDPGTPPLAWPMPTGFEKMVPADIHALWIYLSNQTPITGTNDKATQEAALFCSATVTCASGTCSTATSECVPATCGTTADCSACQTCSTGACGVPVFDDAGANVCVTGGI